MNNITISGVAFPAIDWTDASVMEVYQQGLEVYQDICNRAAGNKTIADMITTVRDICDHMSEWLDDLFGAGAGEKVFGGTASLKLANQVASDIVDACEADFIAVRKAMDHKNAERNRKKLEQAGNRSQRRAAERNRRVQKGHSNTDLGTVDRYDPDRVRR